MSLERDYTNDGVPVWGRKGPLRVPTENVNSLVDHRSVLSREPILGNPLLKILRAASHGNTQVSPCVVRLLSVCSPAAIARFVMAVIVDAFQCVAIGWARTHVSHERGERHKPFRCDVNTSRTVRVESRISWVDAPAFHSAPDAVLGAVALAVVLLFLPEQASTTHGFATSERVGGDRSNGAAVTSAHALFSGVMSYNPITKTLAVKFVSHVGNL